MTIPIADIHLHPTMKPYGHSFYKNENKTDLHSSACIWHPDPPSDIEELEENILGFPPYRECDFTTMVDGRVNVAVAALYPVETGFVNPTIFKPESKELMDMITLFGRYRIDYLKSSSYNYYEDLKNENAYLLALNGKPPVNGLHQYELIAHGKDLATPSSNIRVLVSIEGAHVFCNGTNVEDEKAWTGLKERIEEVKHWEYPPFFITFCHHFYNGLASHAQSLFIKVLGKELLDQTHMMDQPVSGSYYITPRGYEVIDQLYSITNGKRILIDIKHMAKNTRAEFYAYRKTKRYDSIPLISSHSGLFDFYNENINLNSEDVKEIYRSKGLIGIELDQRIVGYNQQQGKNRFWNWLTGIFRSRQSNDILWAEYFWKNISTIAEQCYDLDPNSDPWKIICLGSDFDGIINPLNKFRTSADLQALAETLLKYLTAYWASGNGKIPKYYLSIDAHDVVYQIMYKNAYDFIELNYQRLTD
jgi:hypothetical protein